MEQRVREYIERHRLITAGDEVIAGISGGLDSMCLLFLLIKLEASLGFHLQVVHVQHGIRADLGEHDRCFVEAICERLGRRCYSVKLDVPAYAAEQGMGLEEAARILRYQVFDRLALKLEAEGKPVKVAVGHHRNDQAETMLWHMTRGSSLRGLGGMLPRNERLIRPLLAVSRDELQSYALREGIDHCEDESNTALNFTRNRIRQAVLPELIDLNSEMVAHFSQLAEDVQEVEAYLNEQAATYLKSCTEPAGALAGDRLLRLPPLMQRLVLMQWLDTRRLPRKDLQRSHLRALLELCGKPGHASVNLPGGWRIESAYGSLLPQASSDWQINEGGRESGCGRLPTDIRLIRPAIGERLSFEYGHHVLELESLTAKQWQKNQEAASGEADEPCQIYFDYDKIKGDMSLRPARPEDRIYLGEKAGHKSFRRFTIDAKIHLEERRRIPAVADDEGLLWLIGYRRSGRAYVTEETGIVGVMTYRYKEV
ncbi:MAG: tRNA lysidine(34) synthetase TilS [Lachnospiraceae bacterium]|nr:tRNA lysidine(34) synthetase TilS [Lachnospiraceae bacterium]MDY5741674.1 tRNA lysidine(34) synthetase TilS [Lachnospiraceae bacterium]